MNPAFMSELAVYMMEESSIICLTYNNDGIIIESNKFADALFGQTLKGLPLHEFFIDFGKSATVLLTGNISPEKRLININTHSGLPETYYFRFFNHDNVIMAVGELNNKEVEVLRKSLLDVNRELNNLTRELHKKNAELVKLNDLKNEFLGIAAHDLRNPIGIIMGYSSFLMEELETDLSSEQVEMLKTIQGTSEFMLHLLNQLLDISAIESGKLNLDLQFTDLVELVHRNANLNAVIAARKQIQICVECYEYIPEIKMDVIKIEQVLNNLISNAIKFSLPGTTIKVSTFLGGDYVTVAVIDQGQGIPSVETDKLFKPFQRTSVKSTSGEKSTGLGLSIVRNIILGHQGRIWVESSVGVGTTFYFSLPIKGPVKP